MKIRTRADVAAAERRSRRAIFPIPVRPRLCVEDQGRLQLTPGVKCDATDAPSHVLVDHDGAWRVGSCATPRPPWLQVPVGPCGRMSGDRRHTWCPGRSTERFARSRHSEGRRQSTRGKRPAPPSNGATVLPTHEFRRGTCRPTVDEYAESTSRGRQRRGPAATGNPSQVGSPVADVGPSARPLQPRRHWRLQKLRRADSLTGQPCTCNWRPNKTLSGRLRLRHR